MSDISQYNQHVERMGPVLHELLANTGARATCVLDGNRNTLASAGASNELERAVELAQATLAAAEDYPDGEDFPVVGTNGALSAHVSSVRDRLALAIVYDADISLELITTNARRARAELQDIADEILRLAGAEADNVLPLLES